MNTTGSQTLPWAGELARLISHAAQFGLFVRPFKRPPPARPVWLVGCKRSGKRLCLFRPHLMLVTFARGRPSVCVEHLHEVVELAAGERVIAAAG